MEFVFKKMSPSGSKIDLKSTYHFWVHFPKCPGVLGTFYPKCPVVKGLRLIVGHNLLCFRAFITALANGNTIRVFKVNKKKDGSGASVTGEFDFPVKHSAEIINIAVASSGKFIMSCSSDTTIILWNLKGML